ncbi:hypothetical protein ElyMa_005653100 [Elysia marginata]|uniref:Uncharacterized protein n=1 Tax=Elysia marginata TaxID=1093978 RepID=A0AAV4FBX1_9GAST|nr:hypothetical protein ElyMa_005653100 [Elysia marginata]
MADGLTGPVSQTSAVKPTVPMGVMTSYVIVFDAQGLTLDERLACSAAGNPQHPGQQKAGAGASGTVAADDSAAIVVPLVVLTVWRTAGVTVAAASRDLRCRLNGQDIAMEAHLIPGQSCLLKVRILKRNQFAAS